MSDDAKLQKGMVFLGEVFDKYYVEIKITPLTVLFLTFNEIAGSANHKIYFQVKEEDDEGNPTPDDKELKFRGLNKKATGIKFKVRTPVVTKKIFLKPIVDDFDPEEDKVYRMNVSFPETRKTEISGIGYVAKNVSDIVRLSGLDPANITDIDSPTRYLFSSISYRRCI